MIRRLDRAKIQLASTCNSDSFVELATGLVAFLFTLACLRRSGKRTLPFGHSMSFEPTLKGNMMACMNTELGTNQTPARALGPSLDHCIISSMEST